jgi:ORMDL family
MLRRLSDPIPRAEIEVEPSWVENPNVEWVYGKGAWFIYIFVLTVPRFLLSLVMSVPMSWTVVHLVHNVATFIMFHWVKGNPFSGLHNAQGKYDKLTFWEQLDSGTQYTPTRKFLTLVPVLLFITTTHYTNYDFWFFLFNVATFAPVIIGKFAQMHRIRLFGINKD